MAVDQQPTLESVGFPPWFEPALRRGLGIERDSPREAEVLAALDRFHDAWLTGDTATFEQLNRSPDVALGYAFFYLPINLPKLWWLLDKVSDVFGAGALRAATAGGGEGWKLVELGCGSGTFIWSMIIYLAQRDPALLASLTTVEGDDLAENRLYLAERFAETFIPELPDVVATFDWRRRDWREALSEPADIMILGNTLVEQPAGWQPPTDLPVRLVIAIEPGTRDAFARLRPWRDALLAAGWRCLFPCPSAAVCPMVGTDNWCHFHINRMTEPFVQRLCARARRQNPRHNFCGFLFLHPSLTEIAVPPAGPPTWRVLSKLRRVKRSGVRWLCDGETMLEAVLNRRAKGKSNRAFLDAGAGDLLLCGQGNDHLRRGRVAADAVLVRKGEDD